MSDETYEAIAVYSQVVASVLFIVALIFLWIRFIAPAVVASQARKNAELSESEQRRDAARAEVETAEKESAAADADVRSIGLRAAADAARLHDKTLADAREEGARLIRSAEGELERARAAARERLQDELLERAMTIARAAAGNLDDGTDRRLVGDAVDAAERSGKS